jgi:hypothetical protein
MLKHKRYSEQELVAFIQSAFTYKDGYLYRKSGAGGEEIGSKAGCKKPRKEGHIYIGIKNQMYGLHRIIFAFHYGYTPDFIDHKDRNKLNNKIENLRECSWTQNITNMGLLKSNSSGFKGVTWDKKRSKWLAQIGVNGKNKHLGYLDDIAVAAKTYDAFAKELFGDFAATNEEIMLAAAPDPKEHKHG